MNHTRTAAIVGGDVRQVFLGELLAADGMRVGTVGLDRHVCELPIFCDMATLFAEADVVLLPMPVTRDEMYLHAPLANAPYRLKDVLDAITAGTSVYGGAIPQTLYEPARRREIRLYDYLKQEELALLNAIPTAEGAIQIAMEQLPVTIHDLSVLVIGAGRIGSAVAMRLRGLGARVTVSARREADFARMYSAGYHCLDTRRLEGQLHAFPLIINTVPADILSRAVLADCAPDTLLLDLASGEGGVCEDAKNLCRVIHALSLPGKVAPKSAAAAIAQTVRHMLEREGLI